MIFIQVTQIAWATGSIYMLIWLNGLSNPYVSVLVGVLALYGFAAVRLTAGSRWPWIISIVVPIAALVEAGLQATVFWKNVHEDPPLGHVTLYFSILFVGLPAAILLVSLGSKWRILKAVFLTRHAPSQSPGP